MAQQIMENHEERKTRATRRWYEARRMTESHSSSDVERLAAEIVAAGRAFGQRGFAPATSGNLSARLDERRLLLTASGLDKGELSADGLLIVDMQGAPVAPSSGHDGGPAGRPSAETALHVALYRRFPSAHAVLHVHSPAATTISMLVGAGQDVRLEGWELLKALDGVTTHEHVERVPVVANDQDTQRLAARADERLAATPGAHAYLIAGHGLYTWGRSVADARRHVEALESLFDLELRRRMIQGGQR